MYNDSKEDAAKIGRLFRRLARRFAADEKVNCAIALQVVRS